MGNWTGDVDGVRTKNGFCTAYCQVYDESTGNALCGDGEWHQSGTDCTGCADIAEDPIIPEDERIESNGLCASTESMAGHALWGRGIDCDSILGCCSEGGPTPDHVCVC